jgi:O-antigen/teichoic acid export membrane protein
LALSTSWALLSRLAGIALGAVATGVLARSLDAGAFGAFLFALTVVGLVGALSDFGVSTIALRELAARPHDAPGIAAGIVIYRSVVTLAVAPLGAAAGLLAEAGPDRATFFIVYLVVIPGPLLGLQIVPQAQARIGLASAPSLVQSLVWAGLAVLAAARGWNPVHFAWLFTGSYVAQAAVTWAVARSSGDIAWHTGPNEAGRLWKRSRLVGLSTAIYLGYHRGDTVIVQALAGSSQTALYGGAYRLVESANLLAGTLFGALIPSVVRSDTDRRRPRALALELAGLAGLGGGLALLLAAGPLTSLLFGAAYDSMVPVAEVGAVVAGAFVFEVVLNQLLIAEHVVRGPAALSPISVLLQTVGVLLVVGRFGAFGAMVVTASVQILRVVALAVMAGRAGIALPLRWWAYGASVTALTAIAHVSGASGLWVGGLVLVGSALGPAMPTELRTAAAQVLERQR